MKIINKNLEPMLGVILKRAYELKIDYKINQPIVKDGKNYYADLYFPKFNLAVFYDKGKKLKEIKLNNTTDIPLNFNDLDVMIVVAFSTGQELIDSIDRVIEELEERSNSLHEDKSLDKIKTQMHKTHHKDFEAIVVGTLIKEAVFLKLNYKTQQPVRLEDGKLYLIDLYFPDIKLAIECDEAQHLNQVAEDTVRASDIVNLLKNDFIRINAHSTGQELINGIDDAIKEMRNRKNSFNGKTISDFDYETELTTKDELKKYLLDNNITSKFNNNKLKSNPYGDGFLVEYNNNLIEYINIVDYNSHNVITLKFNPKCENVLINNLDKFSNINNISKPYFKQAPNVVRFEVKNNELYTINLDKAFDMAVKAALDIKDVFLKIMKDEGVN